MTTKGPEHRRQQAQNRRRGLIYRTLWGNHSSYSRLPPEFQEAVDVIAESPYLDFGRLAELIGESYCQR